MFKNLLTAGFLFIPLMMKAADKRTFFPASSLYFWILVAVVFYIVYLYRSSKFPISFLKSTFAITSISAVGILFLSYIAVNNFFKDPAEEKIVIPAQPSISQLLEIDRENALRAEAEFTNVDVHIKYIEDHFKIPESWEGKYQWEKRDDFTIYNFYSFKLDLTDPEFLNISHFAIALFKIQERKYREALISLNEISNKKFPYLDYYLAFANEQLLKDDIAINFYKKASGIKNRFTEKSYINLISLLQANGNFQELIPLLSQPQTRKYISDKLGIRLYFINNDLISYYTASLHHVFRDIKWSGFIAALSITLIWLYYIVRMDLFEKEGYLPIITILFTGMISSLLCFYFYDLLKFNYNYSLEGDKVHKLVYSVFAIGLIEEFVKILPLLLLLIFSKNIVNEAYDYILYACISALGFAFMENLLYFDGDLDGILHGRAMTAVPGHMIDSSIVAYGFVLSKYRYKDFPLIIAFPVFLFLGCISHGLYDYWLFIHATPVFWLHFLVSASIWIIIINNSINNSPVFSYNLKFQTGKIQMYMAFSLIGILIMEYGIVAFEQGPSYANRTFNSTLFLGGIFIIYYVDKLTNMDFVRGYWNTISITSIEDKRRGEDFDFQSFFLRLISGDLISHSFVNNKILIQCHPDNHELLRHFNTVMKAVITDRLIVKCIAKLNQKEYSDPYWFQIKTEKPLDVGGYTGQDFIFRFEDSRPSFRKSETLYIYLYCFKNYPGEIIKRDDIRALGKVMIKMQS